MQLIDVYYTSELSKNFRTHIEHQLSLTARGNSVCQTSLPIAEGLARQALWRHLLLLGLAQSKPSGLAQACIGQAHTALDVATGLV